MSCFIKACLCRDLAPQLLAGKLKSLLGKFKANEDRRIDALEAAKKEVTRMIQMYEDIMLRSDKVEEPR